MIVVCDGCNKQKSESVKYYHYSNENRGERYFQVTGEGPVMQIITSQQKKKGRPYQRGVNYISHMSFLGSWGWKMSESENIKEIKEKDFQIILDEMFNEFTKEFTIKPASIPMIPIIANTVSNPELRKYTTIIVKNTVNCINSMADNIPDDVCFQKEQNLLKLVIDELLILNNDQ